MRYFGAILVTVALAITGGVYVVVHKTTCSEHQCFSGMRPAMVRGLAGYTCGCITEH